MAGLSRVPYFELTAAEQQALHDWVGLHGVDHTRGYPPTPTSGKTL